MLRRSHRFLPAVVLVALVSTPLLAQELRIEQFSLPNGLRVVLNEDHSAPLVAVNLWYHVGSKNEVAGRTGFAHLFEHMLFSGSEHVGNNEHFRHIQSVGGVLNGSTNFDRTNYFETLPSNYLALGLWLEADRMGFFLPALTQEKLDIQKNVVKEERRQRYDNVPYGTAFERALRLTFPSGYGYSWPTIGSMTDLTAAQLDDVKQFFRSWYAPNNAVLTLVGDFDPQEARILVERYFGSIPRGPELTKFAPTADRAPGARREVVPSPVQLPRVYRLYTIPPFGENDWLAGDLLLGILTGDKASRLDRSLVYDQQLAQDVSGYVYPSEGQGLIYFWATAKPGVEIDRLEAAIDEELDDIVKNGVTEAELARAKTRAETEHASQLATFSSRADLFGMLTTFFGDPRLATTIVQRYNAITAADIQRVASTFVTKEKATTVQFVPEKKGATR